MDFLNMDIRIIVLVIILLIYTFIISKMISKYTKIKNDKTNKRAIIENVLLIILYSLLSFFITGGLFNIYNSLIPSSTSELCVNTGGWTYSCQGDSINALGLLILMGIIIVIHHFLCQKSIYNIFAQTKSVIKYIINFIYMIVIYIYSLMSVLGLYGLFITVHYDLVVVEVSRFLIAILPTAMFIISTYIYYLKNKQSR